MHAHTQAAYDTAKAELDALSAAKPTTEIQIQIEAARAELTKLAPTRSIAELEALMRRGCPTSSATRRSGEDQLHQIRRGACQGMGAITPHG